MPNPTAAYVFINILCTVYSIWNKTHCERLLMRMSEMRLGVWHSGSVLPHLPLEHQSELPEVLQEGQQRVAHALHRVILRPREHTVSDRKLTVNSRNIKVSNTHSAQSGEAELEQEGQDLHQLHASGLQHTTGHTGADHNQHGTYTLNNQRWQRLEALEYLKY